MVRYQTRAGESAKLKNQLVVDGFLVGRRAKCYIPERTASFFRSWEKTRMEFYSAKSTSNDLRLFGGCREGDW